MQTKRTNGGTDDYIKKQVAITWKLVVDSMIVEMVSDSKAIKAKIEKSIEDKIRGQLAALMREKK